MPGVWFLGVGEAGVGVRVGGCSRAHNLWRWGRLAPVDQGGCPALELLDGVGRDVAELCLEEELAESVEY